MATKVFAPSVTEIYYSYDVWYARVKERGWYIVVKRGGISAQDSTYVNHGFWGNVSERGWLEKSA